MSEIIRSVVFLFIYFYLFACNAVSKQEKYEVLLNDMYQCHKPHPPFTKNPRMLLNYSLTTLNGKRYMTGYTTVTNPIAFKNFSARTFLVHNTHREIKMEVASVSCKNIFARAILIGSNVSFTKNCMLKQGRYPCDKLDLNKVAHRLPAWHGPGAVLHQLQLVADGATEACMEVSATIRHG